MSFSLSAVDLHVLKMASLLIYPRVGKELLKSQLFRDFQSVQHIRGVKYATFRAKKSARCGLIILQISDFNGCRMHVILAKVKS